MRRQINQEELETLYHSIGRVIWNVQYLEDALHTYLTMKIEVRHPGRIQIKDANELLAKHRRATLGTAIATAEKAAALPLPLIERLKALKGERDWLVHRSMNQSGDSLYTHEGRKLMFRRVNNIYDSSTSIRKEIMQCVDAFCQSHGLSPEQSEALARRQVAKLRGEA